MKIAILNQKRENISPEQHCIAHHTSLPYCVLQIEKKMLVECFVNGKLTIDCDIEYFIPKDPALSSKSSTVADIHEKPFSNSDQLVAELEGLFENMKFSTREK